METTLIDRIEQIRQHCATKKGEMAILQTQKEARTKRLDVLKKENEQFLTKKLLLEESCSEARENGRELLSQIATTLVQSVFTEQTAVNLAIQSRDNVPTADVIVLNEYDGETVEIDPSDSDGGGLADVVSLSLFMAVGQTVQDNYAGYILDEPSKYISKGELSERFAESFKELVAYTGKQTIVSTHDEGLLNAGDVRYRIEKNWDTGVSTVTREDV